MKTRLAGPLAMLLLGAGCSSSGTDSCSTTDASCPTTPPSYATDVAPVIETYCAGCHVAGGEVSGVPLTSLVQVQARADAISLEMNVCSMPPLEADQPTDAERQALLEWLACGAPDN